MKKIIFAVFTLTLIFSGSFVLAEDSPSSTNNSASNQITDISNTIKEKTPEFISKPIISTANAIEKFRVDNGAVFLAKKTEGDSTSKKDLYGVLAYIFNTKILFYGIFIFLIVSIVRFIWLKIL